MKNSIWFYLYGRKQKKIILHRLTKKKELFLYEISTMRVTPTNSHKTENVEPQDLNHGQKKLNGVNIEKKKYYTK